MSITISKISPQKNRKNRYSLYSDNTFITGVSEEVLISFGIYKGCQINNDTLDKIVFISDFAENEDKIVTIRYATDGEMTREYPKRTQAEIWSALILFQCP